jgi:GNAT superfamily N-acetyltransferase
MTALPAGYRLRPAVPADFAAVDAIDAATDSMFDAYGGVPDADLDLRALFDHVLAHGHLWIAETGTGAPAGFLMTLEIDGQAYLREIGVAPAHGRRGLGAAMLEWCAGWCAQNGYAELWLRTFTHVPWNRPFYLKHGFADVPEAEWGPQMRADHEAEGEIGFDLDMRTVMKRRL